MPGVTQIANTASPWTAAIAPAVQGGFGIIGSGLNYYFSKKLAEQQNEYNLNMWNLQNEYNSPQAQMQRLEDAGLNKALMYGQGSTGNAAHAPEMVTPEAPRVDRDLIELSKAFNIEGLRKAVADRKKAEADAKNAGIDAERNKQSFEGEKQFGLDYVFDPVSGKFIPAPPLDEVDAIAYPYARYVKMKALADNFRNVSLIVPRRGLIEESKNLTHKRAEFLAPQIEMRNFDADFYKQLGYWSGPATTILKALLSVLRH